MQMVCVLMKNPYKRTVSYSKPHHTKNSRSPSIDLQPFQTTDTHKRTNLEW